MNFRDKLRQSRFLRFAAVGAVGFVVNEAALYVALTFIGLGKYGAGIFSFLVAVTFTWWGNRVLTFRSEAARGGAAVLAEWFKFVLANGIGFLVNYGVYAGLITFAPAPLDSPYLALACGTVAGLIFNFTLSRRLVFRSR